MDQISIPYISMEIRTASYGSKNVAYDSKYGNLPTATKRFRFDGWLLASGEVRLHQQRSLNL